MALVWEFICIKYNQFQSNRAEQFFAQVPNMTTSGYSSSKKYLFPERILLSISLKSSSLCEYSQLLPISHFILSISAGHCLSFRLARTGSSPKLPAAVTCWDGLSMEVQLRALSKSLKEASGESSRHLSDCLGEQCPPTEFESPQSDESVETTYFSSMTLVL